MSYSTIAQLLELCRAGDAFAVERLVHAYQQDIFRLALSVLDDPVEAEDAVQDTFVKALDALDSYRGDSAFKTWLYAIALNICRGRLRQRRAHDRLRAALRLLVHQGGRNVRQPEEAAIRSAADEQVWQAIQELGERHRLPIILRYYHNLSVAEIAELLGTSEGTVHSRMHTARGRLRASLHDRLAG